MQKPLSQDFVDSLPALRSEAHYNAMMRIGDISRLYRDSIRRLSEEDGLPASYRPVLFHLSKTKTGVTQLDLVKATHLKAPTISVTLQKMEHDGLVIRKNNENDLRETIVSLSDKGKEINERIRERYENCDRIALAGLSADELATLSETLNKIIDNLIAAR